LKTAMNFQLPKMRENFMNTLFYSRSIFNCINLLFHPLDLNRAHFLNVDINLETAVAQWLRCCATNRNVAGSIPAVVSGFSIDIKSFRSHYGPGVDSASNRNEFQEYFLGAKAAGA